MGFKDWLKGPAPRDPNVPLTPDAVVATSFTSTKFAEGYDVNEVDHFLDQIVAAWNADRQRIAQLEAEIAALRARGI